MHKPKKKEGNMNTEKKINGSTPAAPQVLLKQQIAQYVAQQSETKQSFHTWMKRLEAVGLGVILAVFLVALYFSFAWKSINTLLIPVSCFIFVGSGSLLSSLIGLHAVVLRAFPPVVIPGKTQKFSAGSGAVWAGLGIILIGLAWAGFWGLFAYATWTRNWEMLRPMIGFLGVALGVGMGIAIIVTMILTTVQKLFKSR
jgi:hypothetical protein